MPEVQVTGEGKVSGNQASIPAQIRDRLDIQDGDIVRWKVVDGEVEVVPRRRGAFEDFQPGESEEEVDTVADHDSFGTE